MKLVKLNTFKDKFFGNAEFEFDDEHINTISGKNGSGKTSLFELISLVQKAYFCKLLLENGYKKYNKISICEWISQLIYEMLPQKDSHIELTIKLERKDFEIVKERTKQNEILQNYFCDAGINITLTLCNESTQNNEQQWKIFVNENEDILKFFWNLSDPQGIIVYISAERKVIEEDVTYSDIELKGMDEISDKVQVILGGENLFNSLYSIIINDYIHERIIPIHGGVKRDKYVIESKKVFNAFFPDLSIGNFSGIDKKNQFILTVKRNAGKRYDIRKLSSGEKLIWYTLIIINYIKSMGILAIDELENHLHETLAWEFVDYLKEICELRTNEISLSQVFLLTHSKNIIYNNFAIGNNYILVHKNLTKLDYTNCEKELRYLGLSCINEKILFVEGTSDINDLSDIFSQYNIHVKKLNNCTEVVKTYEGLSNIAHWIQEKRIVFVIDKDTRDEVEINLLRERNRDFFDEHFCILPKHEIENYFLDEEVIFKVVEEIRLLFEKETITKEEINKMIKDYADECLNTTKRKYLNYLIHNKLNKLNNLVHMKDIQIDNRTVYESYIENVFSSTLWEQNISDLHEMYSMMMDKYGVLNWESKWRDLCDGKIVYNKTINTLAQRLGVLKKDIDFKIRKKLVETEGTALNTMVTKIILMFN